MSAIIREEAAGDVAAIREVNLLVFGQAGEARLVDALRDGGHIRLSLVAEVVGQVVGHVLFSDLPITTDDGRTIAALSLAPMAILPDFQRRGIGSQLLGAAITRARADGHRIVVVLGHAEYYPRFGFSSVLAEKLASPFPAPPEAWMALELVPGALEGIAGRVKYPPPFAAVT